MENVLRDVEPMAAHLHTLVLGSTRILACMAWLPALDTSIMPSRMTRMALACVIMAGIWPSDAITPSEGYLGFSIKLLMEALIGLSVGLVLSVPFQVFHAIGAMIDNQRGATISSAIDPFNGIDSSETSSLLHMLCAAIFFASGGMLDVLHALSDSLKLIPLGTPPHFDKAVITQLMGSLLAHALRMAAPVLLALFLLEVFLGVLSRFAQQMNAFAVALALKSLVAFMGLVLILAQLIHTQLPELSGIDPLSFFLSASL